MTVSNINDWEMDDVNLLVDDVLSDTWMWNLEEGITMCRQVESWIGDIGYHCGLGGSVLHFGKSKKDLDIVVYPHNSKNTLSSETILNFLKDKLQSNCYGMCDNKYDERDPKSVVYLYTDNRKRIDFFILK